MKNIKKKKLKLIPLLIIKILLIILLIGIFHETYDKDISYSNTINLLSVNKNVDDEVVGGRVIPLNLEIRPGTGNVFINSNGIIETDTQLSIRNSQDTACSIFNLDCNSYDYYYSFEQYNLVLEGPSAGAAIAILTAKTVLHETLDPNVVITGSLGSGGVIGVVGGIEEKIILSDDLGYDKVLVPFFGLYNETDLDNVEVIKVLDIIDAYNEFGSQNYALEIKELDTDAYDNLMQELSSDLCSRTDYLLNEIGEIEENTSYSRYYNEAQNNINSSLQAQERGSYYSQGSFCFSANNNLRTILELQTNHSESTIQNLLRNLEDDISLKYVTLNSKEYKQEIQTINDFYVWLILNDRVYEARELVKRVILEENEVFDIEDLFGESENQTEEVISEFSYVDMVQSYALSQERLETVFLWENFMIHEGDKITFDERTISTACSLLNNEIILKSQVLDQYEVPFFDNEITDLEEISENPQNDVLCIYKALELNGRIDTVISSIGIAQNNSEEFSEELFSLAKSRLSSSTGNNFPLIPFIYFDYAEELYKQNELSSALLYTNYALSFSNLDLYLEEQRTPQDIFRESYNTLITHPVIFFALLLLLGFIR